MMKIQLSLTLAIVVITMTGGSFGMPVSEIRKNLDKLFSKDSNDAMTLAEARQLVIEVANMHDESARSKLSIDDSMYDDISELYYLNIEQVCAPSNIEDFVNLESKFHDQPNAMLLLQRPRSELTRKCLESFMERIAPGTFTNESPEEWLALSKIVHSTEPTLVHSVTNGHQLNSALRHSVTETMKTIGYGPLFDLLTAEGNVRRLKTNLCESKSFKMSHMLFGEYVGFDREKLFLKGLSSQQEDTLIRSLVCNWLERHAEHVVWDSYIASQRPIRQLNQNLFDPNSQNLLAEEVHMSLRVISRYDEVSDENQTAELDDLKQTASNLLIPIDYPSCTSDELTRINSLIPIRALPRNLKLYHKIYTSVYLDFCSGNMLNDFEVELETSALMEHTLDKVLQIEQVYIDELGVTDMSVIIGLVSSAKLIENIKMDNKFTTKSRIFSKIANMQSKIMAECPQLAGISLETKTKYFNLQNSLQENIQNKLWDLLSKKLQKVIMANSVCTLIETITPEQVFEMKDEIPTPK